MSILQWFRRSSIPKTAQNVCTVSTPRRFTALNDGIVPEWHSRWSPDHSGFYETRRVVGQSAVGFHAGVEVSHRVCDRVVWSEAYSTPEKARAAAGEMESQRREEMEGRVDADAVLGEQR